MIGKGQFRNALILGQRMNVKVMCNGCSEWKADRLDLKALEWGVSSFHRHMFLVKVLTETDHADHAICGMKLLEDFERAVATAVVDTCASIPLASLKTGATTFSLQAESSSKLRIVLFIGLSL